jgi:hypothetical protein
MALVGRILVVLFAFAVASVAAAIALQIGIMLTFWHGRLSPDIDHGIFQVLVGFSFLFISLFSFLPSMIVIALAEALRLRSILFYATAGGIEALALGYSLGLTERPVDMSEASLMQAFAASGIVAGMVYWLIAGRNAGAWSEPAGPAP